MFASILAALGLCAASIAEGLYAAQHRFSARAAGIGFAIGAVLAWMYGAVTPLITTVESVTVAYRAVGERPKILYVVALSAIPSIIMGFLGWYSAVVEWLSRAVIAGAIAGVGIILTEVGASYIKQKPYVAGSSTLVGVLAYLIT
jgi:adenine/guanine/hypoxanthine permease